jgi:predicted double-glycine peptidase
MLKIGNARHLPIIALLVAATVSNISAHAADISIGGILPGGGVIHRNMLSMREAKYVEMVPQRTDFSCGAAALATILKYAYNKEVTEDEVIEGLMKVSDQELVRQKGFSLLDIKNYTQSIGMRGRGYKVKPDTLEKIRIPTIVLLDYKGYKHFVVLKKATADKAYIADPALGNRIMDRAEFDAGWNGIAFAVIGQGFDRESVLSRPKEALTARQMINTYKPLTDAELFDYGFIRADMLSF